MDLLASLIGVPKLAVLLATAPLPFIKGACLTPVVLTPTVAKTAVVTKVASTVGVAP
ncbi:hypothetical protein CrV_gp021 [Cylindrospermopsis raciborskii virus RM-2018a]|nr:hypothetical protein CrV_gp021 [Cylindrospermopsis raciborskii virus RM-2018a]